MDSSNLETGHIPRLLRGGDIVSDMSLSILGRGFSMEELWDFQNIYRSSEKGPSLKNLYPASPLAKSRNGSKIIPVGTIYVQDNCTLWSEQVNELS